MCCYVRVCPSNKRFDSCSISDPLLPEAVVWLSPSSAAKAAWLAWEGRRLSMSFHLYSFLPGLVIHTPPVPDFLQSLHKAPLRNGLFFKHLVLACTIVLMNDLGLARCTICWRQLERNPVMRTKPTMWINPFTATFIARALYTRTCHDY